MAQQAVTGYCMKCKAPREIQDPQQTTMKNGRPATQGACPACGTRMFKIGGGGTAKAPATKARPTSRGKK